MLGIIGSAWGKKECGVVAAIRSGTGSCEDTMGIFKLRQQALGYYRREVNAVSYLEPSMGKGRENEVNT